jgi:hypothetical protein
VNLLDEGIDRYLRMKRRTTGKMAKRADHSDGEDVEFVLRGLKI